jgi:hypothetical protein
MALDVLGFHTLEPCLDLGLTEAQMPTDPKTGRPSPLAAQVVERLHAHMQLERQLLEGECRLEGRPADHDAVIGSICDLVQFPGFHERQVREPPR